MLCSNLERRFEDTGHGLINSTSIANFKVWPTTEEQLDGYGNTMVKDLVEHYYEYFDDIEQVKAEWPLFRTAVFETFPYTKESLTWQQVNEHFCHRVS